MTPQVLSAVADAGLRPSTGMAVGAASQDPSGVAWLHEELRRSLEAAHKLLRRHLRESEAHAGSDVSARELGGLRQALSLIHQAAGALSMVGSPATAKVLEASDAALRWALQRPTRVDARLVANIEQASFAVIDWLGRLKAGRPVSGLHLFPQMRVLLETAGAERVHPADLWSKSWQFKSLPVEPAVQHRPLDPRSLTALEQLTLANIKTPSPLILARISDFYAGAAAASGPSAGELQALWQLAAAVFEALARGLLVEDVFNKRLGSRLLSLMRSLQRGQGSSGDATGRLAHDLLFFCAQARPTDTAAPAPRLAMVRVAYGLDSEPAIDYLCSPLGRFDPALVAQARKRVQSAKLVWSAVVAGEVLHLGDLVESFSLLADSLRRMFADGADLAEQFESIAVRCAADGAAHDVGVSMEIATALLYVEAALEDGDSADGGPDRPMELLARRIDAARSSGSAQPVESWIEALYGRVAERQTQGTIVQELRVTMTAAEQHLDRYFRDRSDRAALLPVPALLQSMHGVLLVLGVDQAAQTLQQVRREVETIAGDTQEPPPPQRLERLAGNFGMLGFLLDMLVVQPVLARTMFRFDALSGRLVPKSATQPEPQASAPATVADPAAGNPSITDIADEVAAGSAGAVVSPFDPPPPAPVAVETMPVGELTADPELRSIFGDEAGELLATVRQRLGHWQIGVEEPGLLEELRRIFHTLKGSARMVGRSDVGELAWEAEQRYDVRRMRDNEASSADDQAAAAGSQDDVRLREWTSWIIERIAALIGLPAAEPPVAAAAAVTANAQGRIETQVPPPPADEHAGPDDMLDVEITIPGELDFDLSWTPASASVDTAPPPALPDLWLDDDLPPAGPAEALRPLGFPPDLPSAEDLDLDFGIAAAPLRDAGATRWAGSLRRSDEATAQPPRVSTEAPVDDGGLGFEVPLSEMPDLSFITLDLSEPKPPAPAAPFATAAPVEGLPQPAWSEPPQPETPFFDPPTPGWAGTPQSTPPEPLDEQTSASDWVAAASQPTQQPVPAWNQQTPADWMSDRGNVDDSGAAAAWSIDPAPTSEAWRPEDTQPEAAPTQQEVAPAPRQIGPLNIPLSLFNIFLNEADELSRLLCSELAEWAMQRDMPIPSAANDRLHALTGSAATVGYSALGELARELDTALLQEQQILADGGIRDDDDALLFSDAAEEIRLLLHQFAAGFVKSPSSELQRRLADFQHQATLRLQPILQPASLPIEPAAAGSATEVDWLADIQAVDHVEPELFPIFEEEANELLPRLAAALRDWAGEPARSGSAQAAMRHLHTFKGGARLAGAMRLGELAHRLETRIEASAADPLAAQAAALGSLLAGSDTLQQAFEALRDSDARAHAAEAGPCGASAGPSIGSAWPSSAAVAAPADQQPVQPPPPVAPGDMVAPIVDWSRFGRPVPAPAQAGSRLGQVAARAAIKVRASVLERMVNHAGEVNMSRARVEVEMGQVRAAIGELGDNIDRLRHQLHDFELQAETQMSSRGELVRTGMQAFDALEFDRFTRLQELTRMIAESVNDVATVQRSLKRNVQRTEDELAAQTRLTRDLQSDLLRTRMIEFDSVAERLHRVVRQAATECGKQAELQISAANIELDRSVLDRLVPVLEHLLRNAVIHGIEPPEQRSGSAKPSSGQLQIHLHPHGNEVGIDVVDDGAGLDLASIRSRAAAMGLWVDDGREAEVIFSPGFSTAERLTEMAGRGVGLDVVRNELTALDGQIEVTSSPGQGCRFSLLLPLTTALTQVLMLRCGELTIAVPATMVERVRRITEADLAAARADGFYLYGDLHLPMHWLGGLLGHSIDSAEAFGRNRPMVIIHSGKQRLALRVDETLGQQEAVIRNLGPQLSRVPGLVGMSMLASGSVALIYNPLTLATEYGAIAGRDALLRHPYRPARTVAASGPLVLVVDDSLTVRRVTQRLLLREGYRVALAKDGIEALEQIAQELPGAVLSDIEMPRMDGYELVGQLRAVPRTQRLPVVMITSRIADRHRVHAESLGVARYLGKPYTEDELLTAVADCLAPDRQPVPFNAAS